ncbi:hypothetical protein FCV25MIE_17474 [Fagus crenata]
MGLVVPGELASNDGDSEGEEVREDVGVYGIARRERAGHVSTGALVREDPEVELGDEACKVGEGSVGWGRDGLDPES